jgi:hypothetical protein
LKGSGVSKRIYRYNESFFSDFNALSCYWAGFIAADGYIKQVSPELSIKLGIKDIDHLSHFSQDIEYTGSIKTGIIANDRKYCRIRLCHAEKIVQDLNINFGIYQKKSFTFSPPVLEGANRIAFAKGLIDGDGWLASGNRIGFCGTKLACEFVKETFESKGEVTKLRKIYQTIIPKANVFAFKDYLDAVGRGLKRKWAA